MMPPWLWDFLHAHEILKTTYAPRPPIPTRTPERPTVATIGDILTQYEGDATDAGAKAAAAIAADKAASDAADKLKATTATTATDLHIVGPTFIQATDGTIKVYSSADGQNVSVVVPHPASTPVPDA